MDKSFNQSQQDYYHGRYTRMMQDLTQISLLRPKGKYLHSLMSSVVCYDFETAISCVLEDYQKALNDNLKR